MKKKLLISLGAIAALTPIVAVVACGNSTKAAKPLTQEEKVAKAFEMMTPSEKTMIFNKDDVDASGVIHYTQGNVYKLQTTSSGAEKQLVVAAHEVTIKNASDLMDEIKKLDGNYMHMGKADVVAPFGSAGTEVNASPLIIEKTLFDIFFNSDLLFKSGSEQLSNEKNNNLFEMICTYLIGPDGRGGDVSRFASL